MEKILELFKNIDFVEASSSKGDEKYSYICDIVDMVCYLSKAEYFICKFAKSDLLFKQMNEAFKKLPKK